VAQAAFEVNLLTEDNLPSYHHQLLASFGRDGAWRTWSHRWTAEEGRHAVVLRDYLLVTRNIDPVALERGRMATVQQGWMPDKTALGLMAYADLQRLSTKELRAERDRLRRQLNEAPRDRGRELARAAAHRQQAEQVLAAHQQAADRLPPGMLRWLGRSDQPARMPGGLAVATQQANRAHDRERELRQHQQRRDGWLEANAHLGPTYREVARALAWQQRATGLAVEVDRPGYVLEALGPVPASTRGRRAWRQAAAEIEQYRRTYHITDPDRALGPEPRDPAQRADRQRARTAIDRVHAKQRATDRSRDAQPTSERPTQPRSHEQRGRPGPERAAG
jgi:hypothetical protein